MASREEKGRSSPIRSQNPLKARQRTDENDHGIPRGVTPRRTNRFPNMKPSTPVHRASSAGPSSQRAHRRTPADQTRTPGIGRIGSARRPVVVTPHGRAAQRELQQRRAGLTPGKDRRKSARQQRETPRDILRALSRKLAPKSERIIPTPRGERVVNTKDNKSQEDDFDDGQVLPRPRFSLPLDQDEDDDSLLEPPKSAGLEDEDFTIQSVELPRRAASELPPGRYSRGSFGSVRMSDVFADQDQTRDGYDSSYLAGFGNGGIPGIDDNEELRGENTITLRGFEFGRGRESDIRPGVFTGDETTTEFVFNVPKRDNSEDPSPENELEDFVQQQIMDDFQNTVEDSEDPNDDDMAVNAEVLEESDEEDQDNGIERLQADVSLQEVDTSMQDPTLTEMDVIAANNRKGSRKKKIKVSKHGIQYPSLPAGVVKKLATNFARTAGNSKVKFSKETLDAVMQATDWFFEQVSDDLEAYAKHAGRKTIDESDIITLMAR